MLDRVSVIDQSHSFAFYTVTIIFIATTVLANQSNDVSVSVDKLRSVGCAECRMLSRCDG